MWCRRHTSRERPDRVRGPASILFLSLIVFAGAQCKRRPAEPAKPVTELVTGFSVEYKEKVNPLDYFPLAVGAKWTYASTDKWGVASVNSIITIKWITEHVITDAYDSPEGKVFLGEFIIRDVQYDDPPGASETELNWFRHIPDLGPASHRISNYLVAGNYVFGSFGRGSDAAAQGLSASDRAELSWSEPILFFPLDAASYWSDRGTEESDYQAALLFEAGKGPAPNPATYYWIVQEREDVDVPYGKVRDAMKLTYTTNGGTTTVWFKEGLGFVKVGFSHGGSYIESETTLVAFVPASAAK